jgi:DNA helicase HerA-like ATPase
MAEPLLVAKGDSELVLLPRYANRHGLIAGATGTGKTVTLQRVAEGLSRIGVPVFMADVKGDLAGLSQARRAQGEGSRSASSSWGSRTSRSSPAPVVLWDAFRRSGAPGPRDGVGNGDRFLLSRMLGLNETQAGVLTLAFKIADDNGLLLLDLKDLRALLAHVGENAKTYTTRYGNVSAASIGAIQRGLLRSSSRAASISSASRR